MIATYISSGEVERCILAISPQILSIMLLVIAIIIPRLEVRIPFTYQGPLWLFIFMLYIVHLTSSVGDFYGILNVLLRVRSLRETLKCILEEGRVKEVRIYTKDLNSLMNLYSL